MFAWGFFLTIFHIIGAVLGAGGATFAEIFYIKAIKDGIIEPLEADYLKTVYRILRIGTFILVLSGFGYLVFYRMSGQEELIYNQRLWAKFTIVLIILFNALLLQAKKIPIWLGSAISLTSWYSALILGIWRSLEAPIFEILTIYFVAIFIVAAILAVIKKRMNIKI